MAWPISFNLTSTGVGKTSAPAYLTILPFGTEGIYTGIIVKSATSTPMISEVQVPNGSGQTVASIVINDGEQSIFFGISGNCMQAMSIERNNGRFYTENKV